MQHKCECPHTASGDDKDMYDPEEYSGMNHKPGKCKCTNDLKQYSREGKSIWLCNCCILIGDQEI